MIVDAHPNMLEKEMKAREMTHDEREITGAEAARQSMQWYGWGSPVGLGAFALLIATAVDLVRVAFR